jgi:hypothetical protein
MVHLNFAAILEGMEEKREENSPLLVYSLFMLSPTRLNLFRLYDLVFNFHSFMYRVGGVRYWDWEHECL